MAVVQSSFLGGIGYVLPEVDCVMFPLHILARNRWHDKCI